MTHRVGANGEILIPEGFLEVAGLSADSVIDFDVDDDGRLVISAVPTAPERPLGGRFAGSNMADRLLEDRRREPR